jgi:hypothetical protein
VGPVGPCSNCAKTRKACTFEWLRLTQDTAVRRRRRTDEQSADDATGAVSPAPFAFDSDMAPSPSIFFDTPFSPVRSGPDLLALSCSSTGDACSREPHALVPQQLPLNDGMAGTDFLHYGSMDAAQARSAPFVPSFLAFDTSTTSTDEGMPPAKRGRQSTRSSASRSSEAGERLSYSSRRHPATGRTRESSLPGLDAFSDPSPNALQQRLATSTNRSFLAGGLIRIYHDSMENALSCWLTEKTCPYSVNVLPIMPRMGSDPHESMTDEWGPNWSNRICMRVCRLDRASSAMRDRPLTPAEDRAASRALQAAIMSFATQWAQSSHRSSSKFSSFMASEGEADHMSTLFAETELYGAASTSDSGDAASPLPVDFDRSIQETFWHQARRALEDTGAIESFRVVFAHIIFALTQRPLNVDGHVRAMRSRRRGASVSSEDAPPSLGRSTSCSSSSASGGAASGLAELDQVMDFEGPPVFLETALRQIFSYRCKLERIERQRATQIRKAGLNDAVDPASVPSRADPLSAGDRTTFNLLFWLGIMFDTLSAAMNKRPLVVSDEDSDILHGSPWDVPQPSRNFGLQEDLFSSAPTSYSAMFPKEGDSNLWGKFFLQQKRLRHSQYVARWPCSYEEAAATLSDAAPIKVLLFRKVTHLQTLLSRRATHQKLQEAVHDALKVYQYWNDTYGRFMLDCVANHEDLPPRIQSWYVVLAGHWHLAVLLLADMIEAIDEAKMDLESQRNFRRSCLIVAKLRKQNAYAVSDLGRCSCPRFDSTFPRAREFHFAVNKGALLTEPWTVVLIRSFSKAGCILVDSIPSYDQPWQRADTDVDIEQARTRCESCIQALWHLGKKSDMALLAATALSTILKDKTSTSPVPASPAGSSAASDARHLETGFTPPDLVADPFTFLGRLDTLDTSQAWA